jgi:CxxC motif-containing protein
MAPKMIRLICPKGCGQAIEAPEGSVAGHPCPKVVKKDNWVLLKEASDG